jgi:phage shock protein C
MYCSRCGKQIDPGSSFCPACGTAVYGSVPIASRTLVRPRTGRFIAGVCAAFSLAYGWDISLVRVVATVILFCSAGTAALAYFILWIVLPEAPYELPARTTNGNVTGTTA